ncbi:FAD-dependent monooxygenase [Sphingomonas bacterium]|uniref:FAD-dependent monooxygenase n=1 Tax=Sphingomonas bacterium TaxID=1895847 RepID=UPI0015774E52|nr:FAD-dependent monooxygenase [Sphingomonas bacterium]
MTEPIIIMGAGIGGLTAALALLRQGVPVRIFEQARAIGDVGAGISLGATASRGLYSLGLEDTLRAASDAPLASEARHFRTGALLAHGFADRPGKAPERHLTNQIHRADLFALLLAAVQAHDADALRLHHRFASATQDASGVTVHFAEGGCVRGAALIGCDGIKSRVREQMFGAKEPRFAGRLVYRFLVPIEAARPFLSNPGTVSYVAPDRSLLRYAVRHGRLINCVAFVRSDQPTRESWTERVDADELMAIFDGWHPDVRGLAAAAPREGTAKWPLFDRDPLPVWIDRRIALLGDAAHPMLPFLGLGAAMAIEDAVVLGRVFAEGGTPEDVLSRYARARAPRAAEMLLASREQAEIYAEGPDTKRRLATTHAERMRYDPATVAL